MTPPGSRRSDGPDQAGRSWEEFSRAGAALPGPGQHDFPLHLLARIPGITPWALLPATYTTLSAADADAIWMAAERGWTIHVNDRHGTCWQTRTPPGQAADAAPQAGEPDAAEAEATASPWQVRTDPAPCKQRALTGGFTGQCGPDPQHCDGSWTWVIIDPYTAGSQIASGHAQDQAAAEQAIADWETIRARGVYDPVADLAILLAASIRQLRYAAIGADAAAARSRLCYRLGIHKHQPDTEIGAQLRSGILARQAWPADAVVAAAGLVDPARRGGAGGAPITQALGRVQRTGQGEP